MIYRYINYIYFKVNAIKPKQFVAIPEHTIRFSLYNKNEKLFYQFFSTHHINTFNFLDLFRYGYRNNILSTTVCQKNGTP